MPSSIRLVRSTDAPQILEIYSYYIQKTAITFETEIPSIVDFYQRIENISKYYPWIVYEREGKIIGYAYANQHKHRSAYQWAVDVTIYLNIDSRGEGIGKKLYSVLFDILKPQGFYNVYAGIAQPNEISNKIHESFGFRKIATYKNVGFKLGKWYSVSWFELLLQERRNTPSPFIPISKMHQSDLDKIFNFFN